MSLLVVDDISRTVAGISLLDHVSFAQEKLQKIAIAGETGSGKTTLLKIVGGLGQADSGKVYFEGKVVKGIEDKLMPGHPGIAYLSQSFELRNNYRVEEVLAYANALTEPESERLYSVCRIEHLLKRVTNTLSGGEKQRVALARLLTLSPRLLLLDEPFSNMDPIHKNVLKQVIDDVTDRLGITCTMISHEPDDILPWADELLVFKNGEIIKKGKPKDVYERPDSEYIAGILGKYNLVSIQLAAALNIKWREGLILRPEQLIFKEKKDSAAQVLVHRVLYMGSYYEVEVMYHAALITIRASSASVKNGDTAYIAVESGWGGYSNM